MKFHLLGRGRQDRPNCSIAKFAAANRESVSLFTIFDVIKILVIDSFQMKCLQLSRKLSAKHHQLKDQPRKWNVLGSVDSLLDVS